MQEKGKAFTLVKLIIAVAIFTTALVSLLAGYVLNFNLAEMAKNIIIATEDARRIIEQMRAQAVVSFSTITTVDWTSWAAGNGCNTLPQEQVFVLFADRDGYGDPFDDDPLDASVNVTWQEKGRFRNLSFSVLITTR